MNCGEVLIAGQKPVPAAKRDRPERKRRAPVLSVVAAAGLVAIGLLAWFILRPSREAREASEYERVTTANSIEAHQQYLEEHPEGEHADVVRARLDTLVQIEEIRAAVRSGDAATAANAMLRVLDMDRSDDLLRLVPCLYRGIHDDTPVMVGPRGAEEEADIWPGDAPGVAVVRFGEVFVRAHIGGLARAAVEHVSGERLGDADFEHGWGIYSGFRQSYFEKRAELPWLPPWGDEE